MLVQVNLRFRSTLYWHVNLEVHATMLQSFSPSAITAVLIALETIIIKPRKVDNTR